MLDINWLSLEAKNIHSFFSQIFYTLILLFLTLGIFVEYFKWPLGGVPSFSVLIGRAIIACLLLHAYPEISNILSELSDSLSNRLGGLHKINLVLDTIGKKLHDYNFSWTFVKESVTWVIAIGCFILLYFTVFIIEAAMVYTWFLLFIFSPVLIALFVIPATSRATGTLFRSLIEVSLWKAVWSVLAALLWSVAFTQLNKEASQISFLSVMCITLFLACSLLFTPVFIHKFVGAGLSTFAGTAAGIAISAVPFTPFKALNVGKKLLVVAKAAKDGFKTTSKFINKKGSSKIKNRFKKKNQTILIANSNFQNPENANPETNEKEL